jgi:exodeoxyribonuclease-1
MVEFSAILCDENFNVLEEPLELKCKLSPGILPEPKALLVTNKTVEEINRAELTHYEMIMEITRKGREWTPALWIGWNTINFDFNWLRSAFYKSLQNPYFHQFHGNRRGDALNIARAIHTFNAGRIEVPLNEKGKKTFKLSEISKKNGINHEDAHQALSDTMATLELCKLLKHKSQELWEASILSTDKDMVTTILSKEPIFSYCDSRFGNMRPFAMTLATYHPKYDYPMCLDLSVAPEEYQDLNDEDLQAAVRGNPKILRTLNPKKHPIVLPANYALNLEPYKEIGEGELLRRAKLIRNNKDLRSRLTRILSEERTRKADKNNIGGEIEEQMYHNSNEISENDGELMLEFERCQSWKHKLEVVRKFEDTRLRTLGTRLVFEHMPYELSEIERNSCQRACIERLLSPLESPWNTISRTKEEINILRSEVSTSREHEVLDSVSSYMERILKI